MMASADHLLSEIQSESLQKLLVSLQAHDTLETGIPLLDSCLVRHDPDFYLRWGDVIHIHGPKGSGKSLLVYLLVVPCCMPLSYLSHHLGGWNKVAFVFDMDGTFDIGQFRRFLVERLAKSIPSVSLDAILADCLKRVHIFRPHSTEQLAVTLFHLPRYHSNNFPDAVMGMIVIHSLEAFHWVDQFKAEQLKAPAPHGRRTTHQNIFTELDNLRHSYGAVGVITHWALPGIQNVVPSSDTPQLDVHSNSPQLFRTFHFHLDADSRKGGPTEQSGIFHLTSDWFNTR